MQANSQPVPIQTLQDGFAERRDYRLRQATISVMVVLVASGLADIAVLHWDNLLPLLTCLFAMVAVLFLARRGRRDAAVVLLLNALMLMVCTMMWQNGGVRDAALIAFPGILVYAAMLGARRLYYGLLVAMLVMVALLIVVNLQGWHINSAVPLGIGFFVDVAGILAMTGIIAWLMASDLRVAMTDMIATHGQMLVVHQQVEFLATRDALTGLPNRTMARDRFDQAATAARQSQCSVGMLYLDLDHFKNVNDTIGYTSGDTLLQNVGQRLRQLVCETDTVCRLGGDEFLVLIGDATDSDTLADTASRIVSYLAAPIQVMGMKVFTGCSLGIASFPADGTDFDGLLKKADMAMYRAKESGRNAFRFFDAEMNATVVEQVQLVSAMRTALARQDFTLAYQPQYELASGRLIGAEALIRWHHAELGMISPARFIPLAERSGLICQIGDWVLMEACRQAQEWRKAGWTDLTISVNVSPAQFKRGDVELSAARALEASGLPGTNLELELTESLLLHDSIALADSLRNLRRMGISFAIDDFGTGYSNLAYLKRFEVERLKIDQAFVRRLTVDAQDQAIVHAVVQMADGLKLMTVAEGIEDAETLAMLKTFGCQQGQGFHWSPAVAASDFAAFL